MISPSESEHHKARKPAPLTRTKGTKGDFTHYRVKSHGSTSTLKKKAQRNSNILHAWKKLFGHKHSGSKDSRRARHKTKRPAVKPGQTVTESSRHATAEPPRENKVDNGTTSKLGKADLGRHVNEKQMPNWLVQLLNKDGAYCSKGIIPVMKRLLEKCPMTQKAYLCSQHVQHISKLRREGSFCGYRNIQMLISYIVNAKSEGANKFGDTFPSIFTIQDMIENAWDNGFNPEGRIETGGIRGTRKYIGTPETQAMFRNLQISCPVQAFREKEAGRSGRMLFGAIESYFKGGVGNEVANQKSKVSLTTLPPIYLQHQGHSMTIVGFEKMSNGKDTLLVFDPSFRDTPAARELVGHTVRCPDLKAESILQQYRRDSKYVRKYSEFEVLYLTKSIPPIVPIP